MMFSALKTVKYSKARNLGFGLLLIALPFTSALASDEASAVANTQVVFRPSWLDSSANVGINTSYLANTQVVQYDFQTQLFGGQSKIEGLQQRYDDRTRDWQLHSQYGFYDAYQQQNYLSSNTGMSGNDTYRDVYNTARTTQSSAVASTVRDAGQRGDISQGVIATSAVTGVASGNAVNLDLDKTTRLSTRTDLIHGNGEVKLTTPAMNCSVVMDARSATDAPTAAANNTERYKVVFSRSLPLQLSSAVTYGATTQTMRSSLSHPIYGRVVGEFDSTMGNESAGIPSEQAVRVSYGITF